MGAKTLVETDGKRLMGVEVDRTLHMRRHAEQQMKKAFRTLKAVSGVIDPRRGEDQGTAVRIYKTMIRPHIKFRAALLVTDNSAASNSDKEWYRSFRMTKATFRRICDDLEPRLARRTTRLRTSIPMRKRVAVAIYWLASGDLSRSVADLSASVRRLCVIWCMTSVRSS
ncbi:hypothetical protein Bbelb_290960 [Branchiostoma belcheri]|nr:hypothetical protein Bbelb_290960 [Branchiostoma belcheri]